MSHDLIGVLDTLCPMHLILAQSGHILHSGPTIAKICPVPTEHAHRFLDLFEVQRPKSVDSMEKLLASTGTKLHLRIRDTSRTALKGVIAPLPDGGAVVNLSFGISIIEGVRDFALTSADFAATDLAVEMLYLVEAKSAAMEASHKLNIRLREAMTAAKEQAFTDTLTGLKNRRALDFNMTKLLDTQTDFALMQIDLDHFKAVNDTLGHAAGDLVLQTAAQIMVEETRDTDVVIRVGGDEFVIIFDRITDIDKLDHIAKRLISRIEAPVPFEDAMCHISCSIGTVLSHDLKDPDADALLDAADQALYASKRAGRACHTLFTP